jgi:phosphoribosylglycinamide formyltransferase-1
MTGIVPTSSALSTIPFYLLTENCFDGSYLISDWLTHFSGAPGFRGILMRDTPERGRMEDKADFHRRHEGRFSLPPETLKELYGLYSNTSGYASLHGLLEASIRLYGVPAYPERAGPWPIRFVGHDVNSEEMKSWLEGIVAREPKPTFFIYLDRILRPWWMERTTVINAHPAVLPHARGMWAIEQVAMERDPEKLKRSAGATVHFVDAGVDTGPIIQAVGLDPFRFRTLPELSAASLRLATRMLFRTAKFMLDNPELELRGVSADPRTMGKNYRSRDFDETAAAAALRCFEAMRADEMTTLKNHDFITIPAQSESTNRKTIDP